jgi:heat shock protein HslJ
MTLGMVTMLAAGASAAEEGAPSPAALVGTTWRAETIAGRPVMDTAASTLTFVSAEEVAGLGACNRYHGRWRLTDGRVEFGPLAATKRACAPALMDQETRFFTALQEANRLALDGPFLLLRGTIGEPTRLAPFTEPADSPR